MRSFIPVLLPLAACATAGADVSADTIRAEMADYASWSQPDGWEGVRYSCDGSHGPYVATYMNDVAAEAVASGATELPEGALLVKDVFADDGVTRTGAAAMRKVPGFAPDAGDWYWVAWDAADAVRMEGAQTMCSGCHAAATLDYAASFDGPGAADAAECE